MKQEISQHALLSEVCSQVASGAAMQQIFPEEFPLTSDNVQAEVRTRERGPWSPTLQILHRN